MFWAFFSSLWGAKTTKMSSFWHFFEKMANGWVFGAVFAKKRRLAEAPLRFCRFIRYLRRFCAIFGKSARFPRVFGRGVAKTT